MRIEDSITISCPPGAVFAFLAHHPNHLELVEQNLSCEQVSPGPMGVGTQLKNTARLLGRRIVEHFHVTAYDPPRVLAKASAPGSSFDTTDRFEITPTASGSQVRFIVTGEPRHFGQRVLLVLIAPMMRRAVHKTLVRLKQIVEQRNTPRP